MNRVTEEKYCRICKGKLETILNLGDIFPSAFVKDGNEPSDDEKVPMVIVKCKNCGLVQLKHTVDLDLMYRQYWYKSSLNKSMVDSLQELVDEVESRVELKNGDIVLDIGSNDNTMLNLYHNKNLRTVGIDPSLNIERKPCYSYVKDYFTAENYYKCVNDKAKVITAVAMFYDLPDPVKFTKEVVSILADDGIFVIQYTDFGSMLKANAWDSFCAEHLEYYTFEVVKNLLESCGLEIIDVSHNNVNGASIRVTASFPGKYPCQPVCSRELEEERKNVTDATIQTFVDNITTTKAKMKSFLDWAKFHNHTVYIMGASTKGNTTIQICGITDKDCDYASEVNPDKFGLKTVGSNIRIISEIESLIKHPQYFIVLPWHFKESLIKKPYIQDYLNSGGTLVFPMPYFCVVTKAGEYNL